MPVLSNPKHELFAQELAKGTPASQAYVIAGYSANDGNAVRLKGNDKVASRVEEILSAVAEKCGVTVERIVNELSLLGFSNMLDYVKVDGEGDPRVNLGDLTREQAAAIQEITVNTRTERGGEAKPDAEVKSVKFRLIDKRAALVDLGKYLGMFKEKVEHSGAVSLTPTINVNGNSG
jgi:phage terminase small subunit